eukprot:scaffold2525_cov94-Isochrysis_galbana.AAC.2
MNRSFLMVSRVVFICFLRPDRTADKAVGSLVSAVAVDFPSGCPNRDRAGEACVVRRVYL